MTTTGAIATAVLGLLVLAGCGGGAAATEPSPPGLEAPTGLALQPAPDAATVTWAGVDGAESYVVTLSPLPGGVGSGVQAETVPAGLTSVTFSGLEPGTTWFATVVAVGAAGSSPRSAEVAAVLPPPAPTDVRAEAGPASVRVSWAPARGATRYEVYAAASADLDSASWPTLPLARHESAVSSPALVRDLEIGTEFHVIVVAVNDGGRSPDSVSASATPSERGIFHPAGLLPVGQGPTDVATGDLDLDGDVDLVTANALAGSVTVLLGRGDGTFLGTDVAVGEGAHALAVGDFDGDGTPDLAVALRPEDGVAIFHGDGAGGFAETSRLAAAPNATARLRAADLDADGAVDLLVVDVSGASVTVWRGDGLGGFAEGASHAAGGATDGSTVADVDADGTPDLVVAQPEAGRFATLFGDGAAGFRASRPVASDATPCSVDLADFDGDGRIDVVVTHDGGPVLSWLGNGDGSFRWASTFFAEERPGACATRDFDGDGTPDLVVVNRDAGTISVFRGDGKGRFAVRQSMPAGFPAPGALAVGDLDGDGIDDLAVLSREPSMVAIALGAR